MSVMLDRLLRALPLYLAKAPGTTPALTLAYDGATAFATVGRRRLKTRVSGGSGGTLDLDLSGLTVQALVGLLNGKPGYSAVALGDGEASALTLLDVSDQALGALPTLARVDSLLWKVVAPLAWALEDALDRLRQGLLQMSTRTAEGLWVDLWGKDYYGGVRRRLGEADRAYADRIVKEALRWRLNNRALELVVLEDLGLKATVGDLHDQAWVVAETPFGRLAGRKYSRTTFEVLADGFAEDLARTIDRNRAAGTLKFLRFRLQAARADGAESVFARLALGWRARIGANRVWTIGVDPLGVSIAVPNNLLATTTILTVPSAGFRLGEAVLGAAPLGAA